MRIGPDVRKRGRNGDATCVGKHRKDRHAGRRGVRRFSDCDDSVEFAAELADGPSASQPLGAICDAARPAATTAGGPGAVQASNEVPRREGRLRCGFVAFGAELFAHPAPGFAFDFEHSQGIVQPGRTVFQVGGDQRAVDEQVDACHAANEPVYRISGFSPVSNSAMMRCARRMGVRPPGCSAVSEIGRAWLADRMAASISINCNR